MPSKYPNGQIYGIIGLETGKKNEDKTQRGKSGRKEWIVEIKQILSRVSSWYFGCVLYKFILRSPTRPSFFCTVYTQTLQGNRPHSPNKEGVRKASLLWVKCISFKISGYLVVRTTKLSVKWLLMNGSWYKNVTYAKARNKEAKMQG